MYVNDLEAVRAFFLRFFGAVSNEMYHNPRTGLMSYFLSFGDGARLEIMTRPDVEDCGKALLQAGYIHLAFSMGSREKVDALTDTLREAGYEVVYPRCRHKAPENGHDIGVFSRCRERHVIYECHPQGNRHHVYFHGKFRPCPRSEPQDQCQHRRHGHEYQLPRPRRCIVLRYRIPEYFFHNRSLFQILTSAEAPLLSGTGPASLSFRPSEASGEICYQQSRSLDFARDDIAGSSSADLPTSLEMTLQERSRR